MNRCTLMLCCVLIPLGCSNYDSADVDVIRRDGTTRGNTEVSVGSAATIKVIPEGRSNYSGTESVDVRAIDPGVATIRKTILSDTWTVLGESPGTAEFRVYVDGQAVDGFTFEVVRFEEVSDGF